MSEKDVYCFITCVRGCRKICSCEDTIPAAVAEEDNHPKSYLLGAASNTGNKHIPWIYSFFGGPNGHVAVPNLLKSDGSTSVTDHGETGRHEKDDQAIEKKETVDVKSNSFRRRIKNYFPSQSRKIDRPHHNYYEHNSIPPILPPAPSHTIIGHPSLNIKTFRLPSRLLHLLDYIVEGCNDYASKLPNGWETFLYSLTKQDIALRDIPNVYEASRPINSYIKRTIKMFYGVDSVRVDRNQPHVLKYSAEDSSSHTGVELHHDKCDFTANVMMSRSHSYTGGGTFFPDANTTVRLDFGEFLIHPGQLVHGGVDITRGSRVLMILFAHAVRFN